jgi:hypothetical protein
MSAVMHASLLWLLGCAAGPAYAPHVKQSLQLALELLVRRSLLCAGKGMHLCQWCLMLIAVMHACLLWLVAGAAGPVYAPHVKHSLQLALGLLVGALLILFSLRCGDVSQGMRSHTVWGAPDAAASTVRRGGGVITVIRSHVQFISERYMPSAATCLQVSTFGEHPMLHPLLCHFEWWSHSI